MLTGGLRILGIFVFGPPDIRTKLQAKFRQTLFATHKAISNEVPLGKWKLDQNTNQVMLQMCSATKKYPSTYLFRDIIYFDTFLKFYAATYTVINLY